MRFILPLVIFLLTTTMLTAQDGFEKCEYTYFPNKEISTSTCLNDSEILGKSRAYNLKGELIGEWEIGRTFLKAGVRFSFHPNGMVWKANYSSHPDGGIQWYRSYTEYDEEGNKVSFIEESSDQLGYPKLMVPEVRDIPKEKIEVPKPVIKQEVAVCAIPFVSELWLDNQTGKKLKVWYKRKAGEEKIIALKKGQRVKLGEQFQAQFYESPISSYEIIILKKNEKLFPSARISANPMTRDSGDNENKRAFIYELLLSDKGD